MGVATMANKRTLFVTFVDCTKRFKAYSSQFVADSTDLLRLRTAQVPRCQDLAVFMVMTTTDRQTNYFTCAHVHGVINTACILASFGIF